MANKHPGIGLMMAKALAANGAARVYILGRRQDVLEAAAASAGPDLAGVLVPVQCDVVSRESLLAAAARVAAETGHVDLLVCNAGIGGPQVPAPAPGPTATGAGGTETPQQTLAEWRAAHLATDPADYMRTFEVNVSSVWYSVFAFLELLDQGNRVVRGEGRAGWGSQVVVTSSIAGYNRAAPGGWAYGQSKAAVTHAVKQLAVVLPQWNIRCVLSLLV